jgi:hypothetical protein
MPIYDARAEYEPRRDVRDHRELTKLLRKPPQRSVLYPLVGARRGGKTWTLRALELLQNGKKKGVAQYVDLRQLDGGLPAVPPAPCLLLDEPELTGEGSRRRDAGELLAWCRRQKAQGATLLLAMSPAEWAALRAADAAGALVSVQDLRFLAALSAEQAQKVARTEQAAAILAGLPAEWRRIPFLIELVFEVAEQIGADAAKDLWELIRQTRNRSERAELFYFKAVFHLGLTDAQRAALRAAAHGADVDPGEAELLERCHLLEKKQAGGHAIADPIVAAELYPLRVHHLSDIHFGPKAAERVDVKEKGAHAEAMAKALGPRYVAEQYVEHVRELEARGVGPHLVVISGDVAEWATGDEYAEARSWIDALRPLLAEHPRVRPDARHVLIAGGNHDVDWKSTEGPAGYRKRHLAFARAFDGVPRSLRTRLEEPPETRALAVERYADLGVEVVLLGSAELGGEGERDPAREAMRALIEKLRRTAGDEADKAKAQELHTSVSRIDPGLVHNQDLMRLRQDRSRQPVKIAVLHHPVSPLPFTEVSRFGGLVNAGEVKDALVERGFCLVLHGHAHMGWFGQEQCPERGTSWVLRIAAAPSLGSREINEQNGYNEIVIARERGLAPQDKERSPYAIVVRRVVRKGASWEPAKTMGPFAPGA